MQKEKQISWGKGGGGGGVREVRYMKTQPRDGCLSIHNPIKALDTLSGYHGKRRNNKGTGRQSKTTIGSETT